MPDQPNPAPSAPSLDPLLKDPCYVNALSHFYRGELGRIMVWRQRLDVTTTWAITTSTTIIGVAFSIREVPHIIFFFNLMLVWIMLWIEARRYRFYDAFRGRVRMLESHFLVPMVSQSPKILDGQWRRLVCEDLILPSFKISRLEALGRRMKRNYVFIFLIVILAWTLKILLHPPKPIHSFGDFYRAMAVQDLPAWLAFGFYLGTMLAMTFLIVLVLRSSSEEVTEFGSSHSSLWKI
jgi:uncharacterized membrane protein